MLISHFYYSNIKEACMQEELESYIGHFWFLIVKPTLIQVIYFIVLFIVALYLLFKWKLHPAIEYYVDHPKFRSKHSLLCFIAILPAPTVYVLYMLGWGFVIMGSIYNIYYQNNIKEWSRFFKQLPIHIFVYNTIFLFILFTTFLLQFTVSNEILGIFLGCLFIVDNLLVWGFLIFSNIIYHHKKKLANNI